MCRRQFQCLSYKRKYINSTITNNKLTSQNCKQYMNWTKTVYLLGKISFFQTILNIHARKECHWLMTVSIPNVFPPKSDHEGWMLSRKVHSWPGCRGHILQGCSEQETGTGIQSRHTGIHGPGHFATSKNKLGSESFLLRQRGPPLPYQRQTE